MKVATFTYACAGLVPAKLSQSAPNPADQINATFKLRVSSVEILYALLGIPIAVAHRHYGCTTLNRSRLETSEKNGGS
jgi:hypothetical protein